MACAALGLLMAGSASGLAWAQNSVDEGTMSVIILPGEPTPTPLADARRSTSVASPVFSGGTVSARISVPDPARFLDDPASSEFLIIVGDDRGTGAGWQVLLWIPPAAPGELVADLIANRTDTIRRLTPAGIGSVPSSDELLTGRVLGSLTERPVVILRAPEHAGAGIYVQQISVAFPESRNDFLGVINLELPIAP